MDSIKALFSKVLGKVNPLTSFTFWGILLIFGLPDALAVLGIDVSPWMNKLGPVLVALGIRRRLS